MKFAAQCGVSTVLLTGKGEPTLYQEELDEYLDLVQENGSFPFVEIQTNGIQIAAGKDEHVQRMLDSWWCKGVTTVSVSIAHYDPVINARVLNAKEDYDWGNLEYVLTDIEDWTPDGSGEKKSINCTRWNCDSLTWFVYWMQNLPGADNGLTYRGHALTNWWTFIGDFDSAMAVGLDLVDQCWRLPLPRV